MEALRDRVHDLDWCGGDDAKLRITSCFVGNCLSQVTSWWQDILDACQVDENRVDLIFPCWRDVFESKTMNGWASLHMYLGKEQKDCWKTFMPFLRRAKLKINKALYHIKMYARFASPEILEKFDGGHRDYIEAKGKTLAWVLLGSHNCSRAAWGSYKVQSNNVEASVLLSTSSRKFCKMWQARHPFDLEQCQPYQKPGDRYYDEPFTWGRAPFKFAADARYKFNDDSGGGECRDALQRRKDLFDVREARKSSNAPPLPQSRGRRREDSNGSPVESDGENETDEEDNKFDKSIGSDVGHEYVDD